MQENLTIARPYAAAAFQYAGEHDAVDQWSDMLNALSIAVADEALTLLIGHPKVSDAAMLDILAEVLGSRLNDAGRNFIGALLQAERLELAPQIAEMFERRRAEAIGVANIEVTSAFALTDAELEKIDSAVQARIGQRCQVNAAVDPGLIGGAVIKIGDSVIDLSVKGRLTALEQQLS